MPADAPTPDTILVFLAAACGFPAGTVMVVTNAKPTRASYWREGWPTEPPSGVLHTDPEGWATLARASQGVAGEAA